MILTEYILCDESQKKKLSEHAKNCLPNEACAILLGITNGKGIILKEAVMVDNADASPVEFSIKPDQLFSTYRKEWSRSCRDSHPASEAKPSETDKKFMLVNPGVWLIYSNMDKKFAAYGIDSDKTTYKINIRTS